MADRKIGDYQDIIDLPHHVSENHPHMSMRDRAVQFSPFAALTGYDDAVQETARLTDQQVELDEEIKLSLSEQLNLIQENLAAAPVVKITYFVPDERKAGGAYRTVTGTMKKLDKVQRLITMTDGTKIPIDTLTDISGDLFHPMP